MFTLFLLCSVSRIADLFSLICLYKNVVVFPSRAVAIENALRLFSPRLAIVDEHLTRHLPRNWLTSLAIEVWYLQCCGTVILICYLLLLWVNVLSTQKSALATLP